MFVKGLTSNSFLKHQLTVNNHSLSPDILIQEGRDLARVDPGQLQGRPLEEQGSVALVAVGVDAVVDVDVVPEPLADDLRLRHLGIGATLRTWVAERQSPLSFPFPPAAFEKAFAPAVSRNPELAKKGFPKPR